MAKSGIKKMEIEISNCNCKSYCSSDIYAKKENDEYTFTDIRTLVNFEEYKKIGAVTLNNERVILERDGKKIALFGICDPLFKKKKKISS